MKQSYQIFNNYYTFKSEDINSMLTKDDKSRIEAMQIILSFELNGESHPDMLMNVIRYVLPSNDHTLKRLFLMYLSSIQRVDENGKLLSELILAINSLLNDLQHPNEYIRVLTLKFILTVTEKEFIQPLANAVANNWESSSPLVRKHCYSAICHIYRMFPELIPNASEIIKNSLIKEKISANRCSALRALMYIDLRAAVQYVIKKAEQINVYEENLQLELLRLIKGVSKSTPDNYTTYLTVCSNLLMSPSECISLEAALCMLVVSSSSSAVKAAIKTLMDIAVKSSNNSVKMTVLERIEQQITKTPKLMNEMEIDLLRGFQCTSSFIKAKVAQIVVKCVTQKTVNDVIQALRKEMLKEGDEQYHLVILQSIKQCNSKFACESIIPSLLEIIQQTTSIAVSREILVFIRSSLMNSKSNEKENEESETNVNILQSLFDIFDNIKDQQLLTEIITIITRFSTTSEELKMSFDKLYNLYMNNNQLLVSETTQNIILGTFISSLIKVILKGDKVFEKKMKNEVTAKGLQVMIKMLKTQKETDMIARVRQGITIITNRQEELVKAMLVEQELKTEVIKTKKTTVHVDDEIVFGMYNEEVEMPMVINEVEDKTLATFQNIIQLSGYSDPLYIEASLELSQFDISIDTLIVNQSQSTMQNIQMQLVPRTEGIEVIGQQNSITLGAGEFARVVIPVKITGTSTGLIAGYVNYDRVGKEVTTGSSDNHMVLNSISVEALDSIKPATIMHEEFQKKWLAYEWENKIVVDTNINDLVEFVEHLCKETRMSCITPTTLFCSEIGFLSANLYATTIFGDDALANVSVEINKNKITGMVRIRAKNQGVAVSLGDKVVKFQKKDMKN